jgi:glutathione S-transferase
LKALLAIAETLRNSSPAMANRALPGPVDYAQIPALAQRGLARVQQFFFTLNERLERAATLWPAANQFSIADITAVVAVDFARIATRSSHGHERAGGAAPATTLAFTMRWRAERWDSSGASK